MESRVNGGVGHIPEERWQYIQSVIPIACVDVVVVRRPVGHRRVESIGLITRTNPFGSQPIWCHVGGRIDLGETISEAVSRHVRESLTVEADIAPDIQPGYVMQWFPEPASSIYGRDPRKQAVSLCFLVDLPESETPIPGGEALRFGWFTPSESLPEPLWPGTARLVERLLATSRTDRIEG